MFPPLKGGIPLFTRRHCYAFTFSNVTPLRFPIPYTPRVLGHMSGPVLLIGQHRCSPKIHEHNIAYQVVIEIMRRSAQIHVNLLLGCDTTALFTAPLLCNLQCSRSTIAPRGKASIQVPTCRSSTLQRQRCYASRGPSFLHKSRTWLFVKIRHVQ